MNEQKLWKLISQHQLAVIECEESNNSEIRKENEQLLKKEITDLAKRVNFSYSVALYLLKNGFKVSRKGWGWKGTNVYLQVQFPDENSKMTLPYIYMVKRVFADDGSFVTMYFPCPTSDESIFANDWFLLEDQ